MKKFIWKLCTTSSLLLAPLSVVACNVSKNHDHLTISSSLDLKIVKKELEQVVKQIYDMKMFVLNAPLSNASFKFSYEIQDKRDSQFVLKGKKELSRKNLVEIFQLGGIYDRQGNIQSQALNEVSIQVTQELGETLIEIDRLYNNKEQEGNLLLAMLEQRLSFLKANIIN
ncbi:hypothetical protein [Mycoplasmopsis gallopavonis]|uniref:Lipoprotein n=1 Tax=Mycoplasmopsis gallopavonis TaxID=76629 RepID=A0A449AYG7_9BACT|nr:hypothetical protein [Mycoplasmopsis gallopavonis]RIV16516.1 hypothetical protein D1113_02050 [Mycoplasmopsis gallopavonis]VEU72589.1 Uncharacterised protein [Mycoplasmopsis gallopavonis]